jgi:class 3 adenylate cyclase
VARGSGAGAGRSTAIVLFTDLVGSTALRSRLGEDAAEELRRDHDRLIASAVEANRGRLVKHLGDGVMATFTGASGALAASVAMQQALDRHNRSGTSDAPRLEIKIGISAGDVAFEGEDCFGTPVIEAARLCAAAGGGRILVTEIVRALAGSTEGHKFAPVGALDLKGLPAPVPACEVNWSPLPGPLLPMPGVLTRAGRIFVGRDEELGRLLGRWKEATVGDRRLALLAGEPGIGKTRLAVELAGQVREMGGVVLAGRCDEDLGVPYQPFVEALRHYVTCAGEHRLGRYAGDLTRLLPELPDLVAGLSEPLRSDPETERYRLFDALVAWLADVSAEAPVLLVLDDLHWAAKPTLLLLRHVLRSPDPLRLLVVGTYRDSEVGRGHPLSDLLAELRRDGEVERLSISGLDAAGVTAFIEAAAGHSLDDEEEQELPRVVWRETEGHPFFVAEVLRHLSESRAIEHQDGRWVLRADLGELRIPEGVRDVVGRRLSHLAKSTNELLAVAAVVGLEFEPAVVERAGGVGEDELLTALDEATAARLLVEVPGPRYRFGHALVRAALYEELTGARRVALHRRVAQAIESLHTHALDDHLPSLAHHWARAAAPAADTLRAIDYATRAGDRAVSPWRITARRSNSSMSPKPSPPEGNASGSWLPSARPNGKRVTRPTGRRCCPPLVWLPTRATPLRSLGRHWPTPGRSSRARSARSMPTVSPPSKPRSTQLATTMLQPGRACSPPSARKSSSRVTGNGNGECAWSTNRSPSPAVPETTPHWPTSCFRTSTRSPSRTPSNSDWLTPWSCWGWPSAWKTPSSPPVL